MLRYILLWLPLLLIAIVNGVLREALIKKYVTHEVAHQLSTVTLILFHAIYIWYILKRFPPSSSLQAIAIGIVWLVLTLAFEFGFGRYRGLAWTTLLDEYKIWEGRIWVAVPIWVAVAPFLFYRWYKS